MERPFPRTALLITGGLLIWAADFLFIYAFAALACERGYAGSSLLGVGIVPFASAIATAVAIAATGVVLAIAQRGGTKRNREGREFVAGVAAGAAVLALIAIALTGLPGVLVASTCA